MGSPRRGAALREVSFRINGSHLTTIFWGARRLLGNSFSRTSRPSPQASSALGRPRFSCPPSFGGRFPTPGPLGCGTAGPCSGSEHRPPRGLPIPAGRGRLGDLFVPLGGRHAPSLRGRHPGSRDGDWNPFPDPAGHAPRLPVVKRRALSSGRGTDRRLHQSRAGVRHPPLVVPPGGAPCADPVGGSAPSRWRSHGLPAAPGAMSFSSAEMRA